jgi:hypothetical protein
MLFHCGIPYIETVEPNPIFKISEPARVWGNGAIYNFTQDPTEN